MGNEEKLALGHTLAEVDNGMPNSILTDCEAYGMVSGCDENCPVLIAGKCELQDTDNKDLYELAKKNMVMKELSIEEKAKAYDKAIRKAKITLGCCNSASIITKHTIYDIFPELAESEDEQIRKEIISALKNANYKGVYDKHLAWLEKQKAIDVLDVEEREFADNVNSYRKDMEEFYKKGYDAGREAEKQYWLGKQNEQKDSVVNFKAKDWYVSKVDGKIHNIYHSVVKVEPKFHEGDWAVSNLDGKARQVSEVHFDEYNSYYVVDGKSVNLEEYDRLHHLWTIADAKEGDVLAFDNDTIVIFKDLYNSTTFHSYCHIEDWVFDVSKDVLPDWWEGKGFYPATKKQRDLLFAKMKEAGYEWNAENKELKKIEQKSAEWSEEDEEHYKACLQYFDEVKPDMVYYKDYQWLKSIKPQNRWKPTALQMTVLQNAASDNTLSCEDLNTLSELYEQLKKL